MNIDHLDGPIFSICQSLNSYYGKIMNKNYFSSDKNSKMISCLAQNMIFLPKILFSKVKWSDKCTTTSTNAMLYFESDNFAMFKWPDKSTYKLCYAKF